jgi:hypothetical protein
VAERDQNVVEEASNNYGSVDAETLASAAPERLPRLEGLALEEHIPANLDTPWGLPATLSARGRGVNRGQRLRHQVGRTGTLVRLDAPIESESELAIGARRPAIEKLARPKRRGANEAHDSVAEHVADTDGARVVVHAVALLLGPDLPSHGPVFHRVHPVVGVFWRYC